MRGAIASVEIYVQRGEEPIQRLSLVVGQPTPVGGAGPSGSARNPARRWTCRVALANQRRAVAVEGLDSVDALDRALRVAREWLLALETEGFSLYRDREKQLPYFPE
jgi:hypothetical protein